MKTARTVQILDANNNNISPATSVESLYFEMDNQGTTFRMGVRDRLVVAGANALTTEPQNPSITSTNSTLDIPFTYVSEISGVNHLYQINSSTWKIGPMVKNFITNDCSAIFIPSASIGDFLKRNLTDSSNTVQGSIVYVDDCSDINSPRHMQIGKIDDDEDIYGILWNSGTSIKKQDDTIKINSLKTEIDSSDISIGNSSTSLTIVPERMALSNAQVAINATDSSISAVKSITLASLENITINSSIKTTISGRALYIDSSPFVIWDSYFPGYPADTSVPQYLTYSSGEKLKWRPLPYVSIYDGHYVTDSSFVEFKMIDFQEEDYTSLFCALETDSSVIKFKTIDGIPLNSSIGGLNPFTDFKCLTINGKKALGYETVPPFEFVETGTIWDNLSQGNIVKTENYQDRGYIVKKIVDASNGQITVYQDEDAYIISGQLYAKKVFMSSDERLKTDIKDAPSYIQLPSIREFKWKDSSLTSYGVIAQELEKCGLSELISDDEDSKKVDYTALLCLMVKNLQARVAQLESKINQIED